MCPYLFNGVYAYDLLVTIGSIIGFIVYVAVFYRRNSDIKQLIGSVLCTILLILLGAPVSGIIRGINEGSFSTFGELINAVVNSSAGNHFIGRVLAAAWLYPLAYKVMKLIFVKVWGIIPDSRTGLDSLAFYMVGKSGKAGKSGGGIPVGESPAAW